MAEQYVTTPKRAPSQAFMAFAKPFGTVVTDYDQLGQMILYPSLIAARGRARSFQTYATTAGLRFGEAECHFIDNSEFDARVARVDDRYCATVFDAVAYQMLDLFSLALACPSFFREIGDAALEDVDRVKARTKPAGYGLFRKSPEEQVFVKSELAYPLCPVRELAAVYFTGLALDAIWTHELAHAFMGHVDYARVELGIRALNETPKAGDDLRQMPLEAEADRFAAATLVQSAHVPLPYLPIKLNGLSRETRIRAGLVVAAMLTWFWAYLQRIDRTFDGVDPYESGTHPPPLARLQLSLDGARDMLKNLGQSTDMVQTTTFAALAELEALSEAKDWFAILNPARLYDAKSKAFVADVKTIIGDTYRSQMATLEPFRYQPVDE